MSETAEQLKTQLLELSNEDRAALAHLLLESLDQEDGVEEIDEAAWEAELVRRAEEMRSGKVVGAPVDEVLEKLRKKYS